MWTYAFPLFALCGWQRPVMSDFYAKRAKPPEDGKSAHRVTGMVWSVVWGHRNPSPFPAGAGNLAVSEFWVSQVPRSMGESYSHWKSDSSHRSAIPWRIQYRSGLSRQASVQIGTRHHDHELPGQPALHWEHLQRYGIFFFWSRRKQGPLGIGRKYVGAGTC